MDLDTASVEHFIGEICSLHGLPPDTRRDEKLRSEYWRKFEQLRYRPLFVRLYIEAWVENKCTEPQYNSFNSIIETVILKEQTRWLEFVNGDNRLCTSLIRIAVRAAASEGLLLKEIPALYREDWDSLQSYIAQNSLPGKQRTERVRNILTDIAQNVSSSNEVFYPQYPDIIREYMFSFYVSDDILEVSNELWQNAGGAFSRFLFKALCDFRYNSVFIKVIENAPNPYRDINVLNARKAFLTKTVVTPQDTLASLTKRIDSEYAFWHNMPYIRNTDNTDESILALTKMHGMKGVADQYGALYQLDNMVKCMDEIVNMEVRGLSIMQVYFLEERMNACAASNLPKYASYFGKQIRRISANEKSELRGSGLDGYYRICDANQEMMDFIFQGDLDSALRILRRTHKSLVTTDKLLVETFAHMACNLTDFAFEFSNEKYVKIGCEYLNECRAAQRTSNSVMTRYYHGISRNLLFQHFEYGLNIKKPLLTLLDEIENCGCDTEGEAWSITAVALLNYIRFDDALVDNILNRAERYLDSDENDYAANVWIIVQSFVFEQRNEVVPKDVLDKGFAYYLRVPNSESTRKSFFKLLDQSSERDSKEKYTPGIVRDAIIQDALYNPLRSEDAME